MYMYSDNYKVKENNEIFYKIPFEVGDKIYSVFSYGFDSGVINKIEIDKNGIDFYDSNNNLLGSIDNSFKDKVDAQKYWLVEFYNDLDTTIDIETMLDIPHYYCNTPMFLDFAGYRGIKVIIPKNCNSKNYIMKQIIDYIKKDNNEFINKYRYKEQKT